MRCLVTNFPRACVLNFRRFGAGYEVIALDESDLNVTSGDLYPADRGEEVHDIA